MAKSWLVPIKVEGSRALEDLAGVAFDIMSAMRFCKRAEQLLSSENPDWELVEAVTIAAIIRYARCFRDGVRSSVSSSLQKVVTDLGPTRAVDHDRFYKLMEKYIVHSVNLFENNQAVAKISDKEPRQGAEQVSVQMQRVTALGIPELRTLHDLAQAVFEALKPMNRELEEKVLAAVRKIPLAELHSKPDVEVVLPSWGAVGKRRPE